MSASVEIYARPEFLYRFRNIGRPINKERLERELRTLLQGYIWGASFREMNDPMEGFFNVDRMGRQDPQVADFVAQIRENKLGIGLSCFNERADDPLMWAHYADQFYGICVAYHFDGLLRGLSDGVTFSRVSYSEEIPHTPATRGFAPFSDRAKVLLSTKNYRWAYEREWRMFGRLGENRYVENQWQVVSKVYVGSRVDGSCLRFIRKALQPAGIQVEKIAVSGYSIELKPPVPALGRGVRSGN